MTKILECRSIVPGCDFVAHGETVGEILLKELDHLRSAHDADHISEQMKARIRAVIKEE